MSYRLYVRPVAPLADLRQSPEAQLFSWALQDASGDTQARGTADTRETIEHTLAQNALDNVLLIGLIPGEEVLFCVADIPAKQSRFIQQALPFAVEEQIAQDIDTVHLALGPRTEAGYRVAAVDDERMQQWVALFRNWDHVRLDALYPDASLLPVTEGGWSICLDGDAALLMNEREEWFSVQASNLGMFAKTLALPPSEEVVAEVPVSLYGTEDDFSFQQPVISELKAEGRMAVRQESLEVTPLELLAHSHHHHLSHPINLCQGAFNPKSGQASRFKPWKPLIAVAAVWFGLQVALEIGMGYYHEREASKLKDQAMSIYREAFPGDRRTHAGNVRRVIEGQLRTAGAEGPALDFITLMKYTGQEYSELPSPGSVRFNSVNFSRSRGELVVDVRADSYDRLSALRNGLSNQGLEAQIGSVVNESDGARGRLTVSGG
ncbi:type II secretion system protein GspL [Marinobacter salinisoli]|uniref:Type II secretion system protein L n=1 Tax=Marinobacter salinisoli TaxID=2769486 RepID=A0ABX7MNU5_9GAMM|nr:type II secretion system protein GspL [Marinobacter salinisoli]QSP93952.1 type II secretion system protein GspL [Marinobacter salinisoli]